MDKRRSNKEQADKVLEQRTLVLEANKFEDAPTPTLFMVDKPSAARRCLFLARKYVASLARSSTFIVAFQLEMFLYRTSFQCGTRIDVIQRSANVAVHSLFQSACFPETHLRSVSARSAG